MFVVRLGILGAVAALVLLPGCRADESGLDHDEASSQLATRLTASPEEADCLLDLLRQDYDDDTVAVIAAEGVEQLPQGLWEPYFTAALVCLDEEGS